MSISCRSKRRCSICFRALADGTRLRILREIKKCPANVSAITVVTQVTQPTVSYHLKMLDKLGLVSKKYQGREVVYTFNKNYPCKGCGVLSAPIRI